MLRILNSLRYYLYISHFTGEDIMVGGKPQSNIALNLRFRQVLHRLFDDFREGDYKQVE